MLGASGETTSTIVAEKVDHAPRIVHLSTASSSHTDTDKDSAPAGEEPKSDLVAVAEDGSVMCFHGENLRKRWETSPEILRQDLAAVPKGSRLQVELVQTALASDIIAGFFGGKQDAFAAFLSTSHDDAPTQDMLVLITKTAETRHLHILSIVPSDSQTSGRLVQIHTAPVPTSSSTSVQPGSLRLDINTGSLMEIQEDALVTYDLTKSMVKIDSTLHIPDVTSFVRLSKTSLLAARSDTLDVYNPVFQSLQASAAIDLASQLHSTSKDPDLFTFSLVAYFARLEIAVAVYGASLVAVQLEAPKARGKKRRSEGLLIDSIGRGIPQYRDGKKPRTDAESASFSTSFSSNLPGSISDTYWSEFNSELQKADELLTRNDLTAFEELMAGKFGVETRPTDATNGTQHDSEQDQEQSRSSDWILPATRSHYPYVDRRWVLFAIARVFAWRDTTKSGADEMRLACRLPQGNLLTLLIDAGHLTVSNLKSAFKDELRGVDDVDHILGAELPQVLVQVDPVFELLLSYLSSTKLGAVELLTAVRLIMRSLELVQDPAKIAPKLLTFESKASDANDPDDSAFLADQSAIGHELDRAVQELEAAEYYLGDESLIRGRGLSIAFGKLSSCPRLATIRVLRRSYKPEEILSLIYVLRMELVKDGWTTRYLDTTQLDKDDELEAPPDGSISLISDLLCRCIDAVGPGGWLINDAIVAAGAGDHMNSADFLASLKLEISAALEGVQEAVFLRGIISEAVRYGNSVQKMEADTGKKHRPGNGGAALVLRASTPGHDYNAGGGGGVRPGESAFAAMLPLGMKVANARVSGEKVVSGGEVARRRRREVGHLISQKVGAYSLERLSL